MNKSIFTISLDFELHWGGVEKRTLPAYQAYFENTRRIIPLILQLFEQYEVHATWATVGMLFHASFQELIDHLPAKLPAYSNSALSTYNYIQQAGLGNKESESPFHFAPSLIQRIRETPNQEIGTHTYSHYYCNEPGQTIDDFREDLRTAVAVAAKKGITLTSLVFPRNQFNQDYLRVCHEMGIQSVRSNPSSWFWNINNASDENMWKRLNRGLDAYLPLSNTSFTLAALQPTAGLPLSIPASRFLRPYQPAHRFLNALRIHRICAEMTKAAKQKAVYHLWWHPHNFGAYPEQSLKDLETILKHYNRIKKEYDMKSLNMEEVTKSVATIL